MAWDKGDITTDITSQVHAKGGPKANKLQAGTDNLQEGVAMKAKVQETATASQVLKQNNQEDMQKRAVASPAQSHDGQDQSKIVSEVDRVEISADVKAQSAVSRQSDSRINNSDTSVREKNSTELKHPDEVRKPNEQQGEMMKILSGDTPASMGNSMGKAERSTEGAGFGGYSNRAASGLGGYEESVGTTSDVDQDHPNNTMSAESRIEGLEQDRPHETKPGQLESGLGKAVDKMI
jgi:hypothetical protein